MPSALRETVDRLIRRRSPHVAGLDAYIAEARAAGRSFERIAGDLALLSGGDVRVSARTVSNWSSTSGNGAPDDDHH